MHSAYRPMERFKLSKKTKRLQKVTGNLGNIWQIVFTNQLENVERYCVIQTKFVNFEFDINLSELGKREYRRRHVITVWLCEVSQLFS